MSELIIKYNRVTLLTGLGGRDQVFIELVDELQHEIHGPYFAWNKGSSLKLDFVGSQRENALRALGIKKFEIINASTGEHHEVEWE